MPFKVWTKSFIRWNSTPAICSCSDNENTLFKFKRAIELNDDSDSVGATLSRFVTEKYKDYIKVGTIFCVEKVPVVRLHPNKNSFNIFIDEDNLIFIKYENEEQQIKAVKFKDHFLVAENVKCFEKTLNINKNKLLK